MIWSRAPFLWVAMSSVALPALALPALSWAAPPVIAVFDVEDKNRTLPPQLTTQLSAYLSGKLAERGSYKVVASSVLQGRLRDQRKQSYRECYDRSCQIEIGRELAAQKILATQLLEVGRQCVLMSTLYDLRAAASERSASARTACRQDELLGAIDRVVAQLQAATKRRPLAREIGQASAVPSAPDPPTRPTVTDRGRTDPPQINLGQIDRGHPDEPRSWISSWKWITGVTAVAGIGAGIVLATQASSRARDLEQLIARGNPSFDRPTEAYSREMSDLERDRGTLARLSIAIFAVGGALAAGSTLLFVLDRDRKPRRGSVRATTVLPLVGAQTVGIGGQVRF